MESNSTPEALGPFEITDVTETDFGYRVLALVNFDDKSVVAVFELRLPLEHLATVQASIAERNGHHLIMSA